MDDPTPPRAPSAGLFQLGAVLDRTGSNPPFLVELLAALRDQDLLVKSGATIDVQAAALPPSLRLKILRRLATLAEPLVSSLKRAAVLGMQFSVADVVPLSLVESPPASRASRRGTTRRPGPRRRGPSQLSS